jgi:7-carboxy-7-deazaguanine synthase
MLLPAGACYNAPVPTTLTVSEIFRSLQGEGTRAGLPCTFVRLAGCNLRCAWCDTPYARGGGEAMDLEDVLGRVGALGGDRVEVTGGEPLIQPGTPALLARLGELAREVLLETNGSMDIAPVDARVVRIVDFKCPSSGQAARNRWENAEQLTPRDEVKFVIADRADFAFACRRVVRHGLGPRCAVIFSPAAGRLRLDELAAWILDSGLDVRLGVQLHRIIWPDRDRGV